MTQHKILVVDDEPTNIETILEGLSEQQYKILISNDGQAGYSIAKQTQPDLVITDWDMPETDGIGTIRLFKADESTRNIPIIMATGKMISSENLKTALEAGAIDYIRKPIDKIELIARVESAILFYKTMEKNIELEKELSVSKEFQLKHEISNMEKELTKNTLRLINYAEQNNWLTDQLTKLRNHTDKNGGLIINEIINSFKITKNSNLWEEFELIFEQVHQNFYKNLQEKFPDITQNEKRICAFLKLNLNTKDISAITFQSTDAINKARYRLRKKLNLESDNELHQFMQNV